VTDHFHPFLPQTISELLPTEDKKTSVSLFIAVGPALVDGLLAGEDFVDVCNRLRLQTDDAYKLLSSKEFRAYVEAYISLGDITEKHQRVRLAKALLATQVAQGLPIKKRDALDYIAHIQKELTSTDKETNINVQVINTSVPRPYNKIKEAEIKEIKQE
jgi:hypothetical protein